MRESERVVGETVTQHTEEYIDKQTGDIKVHTIEYVEKLIEREVHNTFHSILAVSMSCS